MRDILVQVVGKELDMMGKYVGVKRKTKWFFKKESDHIYRKRVRDELMGIKSADEMRKEHGPTRRERVGKFLYNMYVLWSVVLMFILLVHDLIHWIFGYGPYWINWN